MHLFVLSLSPSLQHVPSYPVNIFELENMDLICRYSRARYPPSPPLSSLIDLLYVMCILEP